MQDRFGRTIDYMRISVTDRCNLRCVYCMPAGGVDSVPHEEILSYEEILRVAASVAQIGISKIKITGGEPLVRRGIVDFIRRLKQISGIENVTLTTNGVKFYELGAALSQAGVKGVNFSLDCLNPDTYEQITRVDALSKVLSAIELSVKLGLTTKVNCVPIAKYNGSQWSSIADLAKKHPVHVRFIEVMPIGLGKDYAPVSSSRITTQLKADYGQPTKLDIRQGNGPAVYYAFPNFQGNIGFISAISDSFCDSCNRVRLTSDGVLKPCLCYSDGVSLKPLLRGSATDNQLIDAIKAAIFGKPFQHNLCGEADETSETNNMVKIGG